MDTLFETQPAAPATGRAFRVIITGSRTWDVPAVVDQALAAACSHAAGKGHRQLIVVHGACPSGADKFAANWVRKARTGRLEIPGLRVREEAHPAEWEKHGRAIAGFIRNAKMVTLGADGCLAFIRPCFAVKCAGKPPHDSHGTADCLARAAGAGIPVRRYES